MFKLTEIENTFKNISLFLHDQLSNLNINNYVIYKTEKRDSPVYVVQTKASRDKWDLKNDIDWNSNIFFKRIQLKILYYNDLIWNAKLDDSYEYF